MDTVKQELMKENYDNTILSSKLDFILSNLDDFCNLLNKNEFRWYVVDFLFEELLQHAIKNQHDLNEIFQLCDIRIQNSDLVIDQLEKSTDAPYHTEAYIDYFSKVDYI